MKLSDESVQEAILSLQNLSLDPSEQRSSENENQAQPSN